MFLYPDIIETDCSYNMKGVSLAEANPLHITLGSLNTIKGAKNIGKEKIKKCGNITIPILDC